MAASANPTDPLPTTTHATHRAALSALRCAGVDRAPGDWVSAGELARCLHTSTDAAYAVLHDLGPRLVERDGLGRYRLTWQGRKEALR